MIINSAKEQAKAKEEETVAAQEGKSWLKITKLLWINLNQRCHKTAFGGMGEWLKPPSC